MLLRIFASVGSHGKSVGRWCAIFSGDNNTEQAFTKIGIEGGRRILRGKVMRLPFARIWRPSVIIAGLEVACQLPGPRCPVSTVSQSSAAVCIMDNRLGWKWIVSVTSNNDQKSAFYRRVYLLIIIITGWKVNESKAARSFLMYPFTSSHCERPREAPMTNYIRIHTTSHYTMYVQKLHLPVYKKNWKFSHTYTHTHTHSCTTYNNI